MSEHETTSGSEILGELRTAIGARYQVEREIGIGGMGSVFLAQDLKHGRPVAIKVLDRRFGAGAASERFDREITIAARLTHPHIVPLHDSGVAGDLPYYVMPFIEGESLRDRLDHDGPLPAAETFEIARDVAEALDYAHEAGIVHRDIKPGNVLLTANHALVSDFGVARALEAASFEVTATQGAPVGTPAYMSPEQALDGHEVDGRTDVYALGCLVYEMLTGEQPFTARTPVGLLARHVKGTIPSLPSLEAVPPAVSEAIERALAKDPADRFPTAGAFVAQLAAEGLAPAVARGRRAASAKSRLVGGLVAAAVVTIGAIGYLLTRGPEPLEGRPRSVAVLPFATPASTPEERSIAADIAADVAVELNNWDSIYAIPRVALAGPMFDLGLTEETITRIDDGLAVARAMGVEAMLVVLVDAQGDELQVDGTLYDVAAGAPLDRPLRSSGTVDDPRIVLELAYSVLDLGDMATEGEGLYRQSSSPQALQAFARGSAALERWRLVDAERGFTEAIEIDSTFALAYHRLAMTLYWGTAGDTRQLARAGGRIARLSAEAIHHANGLPTKDSLHVRAFHAFQSGEYEVARATYRKLLDEFQPADVYGWIMLGSVEFRDPWLVQRDGALTPRRSYNVAIGAFDTALRLQPTFELGYGHLFEIHRRLASEARGVGCTGFEEPRSELLSPWESPPPDRQVAFCPVVGDSIRWVRSEDMEAQAPSTEAAERLFQQSLRMARRWVDFAPTEVRPLEELANVLTARRNALGIVPPEMSRSLADEAEYAIEKALALASDTVPARLYLLSNLRLAAGDTRGSLDVLERALASDPNPPPPNAANPYIATGRVTSAARIPHIDLQIYIERPDGNGLVAHSGAEVVFQEVGRMAGLVLPRGWLADRVRRIESMWATQGYGAEDVELLRRDAMLRVLAAAAVLPNEVSEWAGRVADEPPLWSAVTAEGLDAASAVALVDGAGIAEESGTTGSAFYGFAAGQALLRAGDPTGARRWFSRVDSIPALVSSSTGVWALQATRPYWVGRTWEEEGDAEAAVAAYRAFVEGWPDAEGPAAAMVTEARERMSRLAGEP